MATPPENRFRCHCMPQLGGASCTQCKHTQGISITTQGQTLSNFQKFLCLLLLICKRRKDWKNKCRVHVHRVHISRSFVKCKTLPSTHFTCMCDLKCTRHPCQGWQRRRKTKNLDFERLACHGCCPPSSKSFLQEQSRVRHGHQRLVSSLMLAWNGVFSPLVYRFAAGLKPTQAQV